jgi:hypothetical protein
MKSSISRRLPTMLEHRIWARMLHGRLGVKIHRCTKALGTVDQPQKADVSIDRNARAPKVSDVPLTLRREG